MIANQFKLSICTLVLTTLVACAPSRPPVPPGTIPPPRTPTQVEEQRGHQVLEQLTKKYELDYNHPRYQDVLDIVDSLTTSIGAANDPWHVFVFKDDKFKNAAATQGNHLFIWTAMIDATKDDNELAAVLGHEIGHVLARHTDPDPNESIRQALIEAAAMAAGIAVARTTGSSTIGQNAGRMTAQLSKQLGQALAQYPYSRERELEADHIGLFMMAEAGYDPEASLRFWRRAVGDPSFSNGLSFFSTHPPAGERMKKLRALMPQAIQRYRAGGSTNKTNKAVYSLWQVIGQNAVLYEAPNSSAKALGEFSYGARVMATEANGEWLHVLQPDEGYLRLQDLTAVN